MSLFTINTTPGAATAKNHNLLTQYSSIKWEHIVAVIMPLHNAHDTCNWQKDIAMYYCQMNSLNKSTKNTINLHKDDFTMEAATCSRMLLFKVITSQAQVSTKTTATLIMSQLTAGLGQLLKEAGGNVIMFHKKI